MDLKKLSTADWVVGGSAAAYFIFMFFPWYSRDYGSFGITVEVSRNGWDYFLFGIIPLLLALAMVAQIAVQKLTTVELPDLGGASWGLVHLAVGGLAAFLVLLRLIIADGPPGSFGSSFDLDRSVGLFLAFLATLGLVGGGFLKMQESKAAAAGGGATPPPAA